LWLALLHGAIGLRAVIEDYVRRAAPRFWFTLLLFATTGVMLALGSVTILTFDPTQ
ncbi:MAG: succinate dehydrogenase, partial [Actinobacteria bacterium]|nr:succinate dehydrogenase [Actinomycetota bacterium]